MAKRAKNQQGQGGDSSGEMAGAIGGLVVAFGCLAAVKDKLGVSWLATVLLTTGGLVVLGYLVWRIRRVVAQGWAGGGKQKATATLRQEGPGRATEGGSDKQPTVVLEKEAQKPGEAPDPTPELDTGLTTVLRRAGAISSTESILAEDVTVEQLPMGTVYDFLVPEGRTYDDVAKRLGQIAGMFGVTRLHLQLKASRHNERAVRLLKLDEPPFSTPFPAPTREEIRSFAGVPIGHEPTCALAGVETFDKASLLVGGMTQMGKTTLVNGLITCLLVAYGDFDLYLLDGKLCGLTKFEKLAVRYEASDDPAVLESMLDELLVRVDDRYTRLQNAIRARETAPVFKPVFFVVDEAADFYTHDGTNDAREQVRRVEDKSRSLVAKSLESGIATIMLTQRPANDAIPVKVRDQFLYRLCLYVASEGGAKVALGDSYFGTVAPIHPAHLDPGVKGQGVLFAKGRSTLIRGFNFPDEFIWEVVDEAYERKQEVLNQAPESPRKQAIEVMRGKGVEFMSTPDLAVALGLTETDPTERGKQLNRLLGSPAGKGPKGVRGHRLADLTAAAMSGS